jgi:hypothetical protein
MVRLVNDVRLLRDFFLASSSVIKAKRSNLGSDVLFKFFLRHVGLE